MVEGVTREVPGQDRAAVVLGLQVLDEPRADHVPVVRQIGMVRDRAREEHRRRECRGIERGDGAAAERVADRVDARTLRAERVDCRLQRLAVRFEPAPVQVDGDAAHALRLDALDRRSPAPGTVESAMGEDEGFVHRLLRGAGTRVHTFR